MANLYRLLIDKDVTMCEINPMVETEDGEGGLLHLLFLSFHSFIHSLTHLFLSPSLSLPPFLPPSLPPTLPPLPPSPPLSLLSDVYGCQDQL